MRDTLPVSEVFGPTWQGEGPHTGRRCSFLRLGLCNLACDWCDTPYTWDRTRYDVDAQCPPMTTAQILNAVMSIDARLLVLSGGEPLIHQRSPVLAALLPLLPHELHVETNGTITPNELMLAEVDHFTVSPKVATSDPLERRLKLRALSAFAELARANRAAWKIVCTTPEDVDTAAELAAHYDVPASAVWVMPEGTNVPTLITRHRELITRIESHKLQTCTRLHVLLHDDERGH